ncbi:MAG: CoA ester lyase [Thermomicrobiales bacterium]
MPTPRSILSVPGSNPGMIAKGLASAADEIFLDLEDAVAPALKVEARATVVDAVAQGDWQGKRRVARVNGLDTPWSYRDLVDLLERGNGQLQAIVLPKVQTPRDTIAVSRWLDQLELATGHPHQVRIGVQIESVLGLVNCEEIAASSSRIESLIFGPGDYASSAQMPAEGIGVADQWDMRYSGHRWHYPMSRIVVAARANGLWAIDGPFADIRDQAGLQHSALTARALGYDGKWCIHPGQIETVNDAFIPSEGEIDRARAILNALEAAGQDGDGATSLEGQMLDAASVAMARSTLARARNS